MTDPGIELDQLDDTTLVRRHVAGDGHTRVSLHTASGCALEATTSDDEAATLGRALQAAWASGWRP